jgi:hypothetical protein
VRRRVKSLSIEKKEKKSKVKPKTKQKITRSLINDVLEVVRERVECAPDRSDWDRVYDHTKKKRVTVYRCPHIKGTPAYVTDNACKYLGSCPLLLPLVREELQKMGFPTYEIDRYLTRPRKVGRKFG